MEGEKKRLAVLVGCNYPNTPHELHGCINDVLAMRGVLVKRFGFEDTNIDLLTDKQGTDESAMPTGANIKQALARMVEKAEAGDVLYFHYKEAIVPCDFNLITDLDFRHLVNQLPKGASLTILSDSCHSGGLIDKEKEQIGPYSDKNGTQLKVSYKPKSIPFESILQHLSSLTKINTRHWHPFVRVLRIPGQLEFPASVLDAG
ncbi:hypothetical protein L6164_034290 [Bauhinia variegata]|uniref:Uncharacterized protein n=1 Tax=Bauhinia variegata TaxID=167791 RepID=A0ACB9KUF2_BAUVA|nr:hypothetical protein L6164_034290 [Bauhinia variegata]